MKKDIKNIKYVIEIKDELNSTIDELNGMEFGSNKVEFNGFDFKEPENDDVLENFVKIEKEFSIIDEIWVEFKGNPGDLKNEEIDFIYDVITGTNFYDVIVHEVEHFNDFMFTKNIIYTRGWNYIIDTKDIEFLIDDLILEIGGDFNLETAVFYIDEVYSFRLNDLFSTYFDLNIVEKERFTVFK